MFIKCLNNNVVHVEMLKQMKQLLWFQYCIMWIILNVFYCDV